MRAIIRRGALPFVTVVLAAVALTMPASADPGSGNGSGQGNGNSGGQSAVHSESSNHQSGTAGTSGDPTQPQPLSNADLNGTGANQPGPYDSTRDGSPSGNGNGNGDAVGEPCGGCVGQADNKNPKGQLPGPRDNNNGYECDGNHGIARSNPAHTGCTNTPPPECDPNVEDCSTPNPPSPPPSDSVLGEEIVRDPGVAVEGAALARTGIDANGLVTLAGFMLMAGGVLVASARGLVRERH